MLCVELTIKETLSSMGPLLAFILMYVLLFSWYARLLYWLLLRSPRVGCLVIELIYKLIKTRTKIPSRLTSDALSPTGELTANETLFVAALCEGYSSDTDCSHVLIFCPATATLAVCICS